MQSVSHLRASAFGGSQVRPTAAGRPCGVVSRAPVVVRAVQDLQGTVVSTAPSKTIIVAVERLAVHDKYFKRIRTTKRYSVHNEDTDVAVGDYVKISGCRPLSKNKRFAVAEVIRKAT